MIVARHPDTGVDQATVLRGLREARGAGVEVGVGLEVDVGLEVELGLEVVDVGLEVVDVALEFLCLEFAVEDTTVTDVRKTITVTVRRRGRRGRRLDPCRDGDDSAARGGGFVAHVALTSTPRCVPCSLR